MGAHRRNNCSRNWLFLLAILPIFAAPVHGQHDVTTLSGSGSEALCVELIMDLMQDRAYLPTRLTYRNTGGNFTASQRDFVNAVKESSSSNIAPVSLHFGASHVPLYSSFYQELSDANKAVMHFPYTLSTIGLFHNIPMQDPLNLTVCTVARIFARQNVTTWSNEGILRENPNLPPSLLDKDIVVVRPDTASHVTAGLSEYLNKACPQVWSSDMVGPDSKWAAGTQSCESIEKLPTCVADADVGAVGFVDVTHTSGWSETLHEVPLKNKEGRFQTSSQSKALGGVEAAAEANLPSTTTADFSSATHVYQDGIDTWPIVMMNYVYLPQDMNHLPPRQQGLTLAFLQALFDPSYVFECSTALKVVPVPSQVRSVAREGIKTLKEANTNTTDWAFEYSVGPLMSGDLVLSDRRQSYANLERQLLREQIDAISNQQGVPQSVHTDIQTLKDKETLLQATVDTLKNDVQRLIAQKENLTDSIQKLDTEVQNVMHILNQVAGSNITRTPTIAPIQAPLPATPAPFERDIDFDTLDDDTPVESNEGLPVFTSDDQNHIEAALVLAALSFACWAIFFVWKTWRFFLNPWPNPKNGDSLMYETD